MKYVRILILVLNAILSYIYFHIGNGATNVLGKGSSIALTCDLPSKNRLEKIRELVR